MEDNIDRKEYLDLLDGIYKHHAVYFNHKETISWTCVAAYAAFIGIVLGKDQPYFLSYGHTVGVIFNIITKTIIFILVLLFMDRQHKLKRRSAQLISSALIAKMRCIANPGASVNKELVLPVMRKNAGMISDYDMPKVIMDSIDESRKAAKNGISRLDKLQKTFILFIFAFSIANDFFAVLKIFKL